MSDSPIMVPLPSGFHDQRFVAAQKAVGHKRPWEAITGITLHQTACDFGHESPDRWNTLEAHMGVSRERFGVWVHDLEWIVFHANELNPMTVGLEIEGNYPGVAGDRATCWQPGSDLMVPTPGLVPVAHDAIRWICEMVKANGGQVEHLYAHRQTAGSRRADPGEDLWKMVALPMMSELGLDDGGPAFRIDNGRVIPEAWNPVYVGNPY